MTNIRNVCWYLFLTIILISCNTKTTEQTIKATTAKEPYLKLAQYLARDEGIWISKNEKYDSTQRNSVVEIQMNFFWDEERQVLWDSVTLRFRQLDYLTWISTWTWHPQKKIIEYRSLGPEGRLISGETTIPSDTSFITIDKIFEPDGTYRELKDDNFVVSPEVHTNDSYEMKNGEWVLQGSYQWIRQKI